MTPEQAAIIAAIIRGAIELWGNHSGKPPGWKPTAQELADILSLNDKTPEDFYREAAGRLGVPWPPVEAQPPAPPLGE